MRVALIAPRILGPDGNPGWWMITQGIRTLIRYIDPEVQFTVVDMIEDNPSHWGAAATCDAAIICGNPRFTLSHDSWWEGGIWHRLLQLRAGGCRVIDGWSGAAYPPSDLPLSEIAHQIRTFPRNVGFLQHAAAIHGRITRDPLMQEIYAQEGIPSVQLPCSSWWANVAARSVVRKRNAVSVLAMPGQWDVARAIAAACPGFDVLASTWADYVWAVGAGLNPILANDPETLLRMYLTYDRVLSFRIHAAIPAAAAGCLVHVVGVDSRVMTCDAFRIPSSTLPQFLDRWDLHYGRGFAPDLDETLTVLRGMLYGNDPASAGSTDPRQLGFALQTVHEPG